MIHTEMGIWCNEYFECERIEMIGYCSRCKQTIKDFSPPGSGMTAGYYIASGWKEFCNEGEIYVCDNCMFKDPRYIKVYGEHS